MKKYARTGRYKLARAALAPDEPMVPRRIYDEVLRDLERQRTARAQIEEILTFERQLHALWIQDLDKPHADGCAKKSNGSV